MDGYYNPHMQNNHSQMNSQRNTALVNHMNQMDQRLLEQENIIRPDMHIQDTFSEGYLSPASAIAQGWTPQVVFVPSSMIHMIPSPMPTSMIPSTLLPPTTHLTPEEMVRFNHGNTGLGLLNPDINPQSQELAQSSFEDMLSSLGLLPNIESQNLENKFHKITAFKGNDRTLYRCPWANCEKSKIFRQTNYKAFTRPYNLKSHYRGHTGERPFVCNLCFTGFARKHDLKRHSKIHEGLKSFSCPFCHRSFTRSDALKRHLKNDKSGKESSCGSKQAQMTDKDSASSSKD